MYLIWGHNLDKHDFGFGHIKYVLSMYYVCMYLCQKSHFSTFFTFHIIGWKINRFRKNINYTNQGEERRIWSWKWTQKKIINIFMKKCANCNFMPTNFSFLKNILKSLIIIIFHGLALGKRVVFCQEKPRM